VNDERDEEEVKGVVSIVICFESAPDVEVIIGEDCASSMGDRPLCATFVLA